MYSQRLRSNVDHVGLVFSEEELDDLGQKYTDDLEYEDDPADGL
ncbi:3369_t:CDS:2 [Funneliformis mosseae]|uniref:3369_t:CDS:1 n=1 Tax=Funneliformis mosseae TaxID=27381 RepID=A0A9N8ZC11_FUNMO|nr:3369_t:CDS:2 [Funneliformis mosseae]